MFYTSMKDCSSSSSSIHCATVHTQKKLSRRGVCTCGYMPISLAGTNDSTAAAKCYEQLVVLEVKKAPVFHNS